MISITSRRGFTLIETLIAVAIIGVLATLAVVSARKTLESAAAMKCTHNLRTTGAGALSFFADNDGHLLPSKFWYNSSWSSNPGFRDYVGVVNPTNSVAESSGLWIDTPFTCPQIKKIAPERYPSFLNRCYSANIYAFRTDPELLADGDATPLPAYPSKLANITQPSQMWMFTEGLRRVSETTSLSTYLKSSTISGLTLPHQNGQNVLFFDGSVRRMTAADFASMTNQKNFWGNR